jgi:signal transduction histidine kinase
MCFGIAFLASVTMCWGQKPSNWRVYKFADGLPESACFSVSVSAQDKVLARHLNLPLVSDLDGYSIVTKVAPSSGKNRIYQSPGGQLWTAAPQGLSEFKDGTWTLHPIPEIASEARLSRVNDPVPLYPIKQGLVIFLLPDRLFEFNTEHTDRPETRLLRRVEQTHLGSFSGMVPGGDGSLWIVGKLGAAKIPAPLRSLQADTEWREYIVPPELHVENLEAPHQLPRVERADDQKSGVTALADSTTNRVRVLACFDGRDWSVEPLPSGKLRQAWVGPDDTRWAITIDSLFEWDPGAPNEATENEEISARQYFDVAVDSTGRFWLATSDGLFRFAPLTWRTPGPVRKLNSPVRCMAGDSQGRLWFVSGNRVQSLLNGRVDLYSSPETANPNLQPQKLYCLRNSAVILEAAETNSGTRLFVLRPGENIFTPVELPDSSRRVKTVGTLPDGSLCVSEPNVERSNQPAALRRFDGRHFGPLPVPSAEPTLGGPVRNLWVTQNGDYWAGGDRGTAVYQDKKWVSFVSTDKSTPELVVGFAEMPDGKIWCADLDQIWEFDGRNWTVVRRGFDGINALLRSRDGSVWVACNNGLQRFFQGIWIENGLEEGLPSANTRELFEDSRGLWVATTRGLSLFHPQTDRDPPSVAVQQLPDLETGSSEGRAINIAFIGQDKWRYTPRDRLLFSYRLDDREWSRFEEINHISLTDLPAGKHYFQVRSMDRSGNRSPSATLEFAILLPWYKETRLLLISSAGLAAALFFAALAFNRHRQLVRSYAEIEQKVAERTKQLEVANYELLQSQKMKALGTLAAGIAHDFNNILSIIKGSAQIIEDNLDNPAKVQTRAQRITTVVDQGAGIVKAMLGFSRDSGEELAACDVNIVVQDTLKLLGDRFLREVQVKFAPTPGLPPVLASKEFIQQILLNFIFNASESMGKNKEVSISSRLMEKLPQELALLPVPAPRYLAIAVKDSGCGIAGDILPRIFEPFFTTKALSARRGTGLGLSMAYELAKKLGAGIWVESVVEQGSTFTLILPVQNSSGVKAVEKPSLAEAARAELR